MTVEELLAREAIRHTLAGYNVHGDRLKIAELVACFTEDGVLELEGAERGQTTRHEGREAIARFFGGMRAAPGAAQPAAPVQAAPAQASSPAAKPSGGFFVRHNITTSRIDLTGPDTADVRTYFVVFTPIGPDHCGVYVDKFRKTEAGWLIAHRQPRVDWRSPDSLMARARS